MRILIIEDAEFMAQAIQETLVQQGHQVDWIIGTRQLQPFVGITPEKYDCSLNPLDYDLVLCDGQVVGQFEGPAIVQALVAQHATCLGISSTPDLNNEMLANGAVAAFLKVCAFAAFVENIMTVESAIHPTPELNDSVNALASRIRADRTLRSKLDCIIQRYMLVAA